MNAKELNEEWTSYIELLHCKLEEGKLSPDKYDRLVQKIVAWERIAIEKGMMRFG